MIKAKESSQVIKARKKLLQQIGEENKYITNQALDHIRKSIHHWINRHANERVNLRSKEITLFDENRHPATPQNPYILNLQHHLIENVKPKKTHKKLKGRIKSS